MRVINQLWSHGYEWAYRLRASTGLVANFILKVHTWTAIEVFFLIFFNLLFSELFIQGDPTANSDYWCAIDCLCLLLWSFVCVTGSATNAPIYIPCHWQVSVAFFALVKLHKVEFAKSPFAMIGKFPIFSVKKTTTKKKLESKWPPFFFLQIMVYKCGR